MYRNFIIVVLLMSVTAYIKRPFHESLSHDDFERYFNTRNRHAVPEYEIVHPVHISGSRHRRSLTSPKPPLEYHVTALGEEYKLKMKHNDKLVGPGCMLTLTAPDGEEDIVPCPQNDEDCFYRGTSTNHHNSTVSLSTCKGLHGIIATKKHRLLIQPIKRNYVADVNKKVTAHAPHLVYKLPERRHKRCALDVTADRIIASSNRRVKRATHELYIEMLLAADKTMHDYHGDDLVNYMLTAANVAAGRYLDKSLGIPVYISIVRMKILKRDIPELNIVSDADKTLTSFCNWQEKFNPFPDTDPLHVDAASLMTRIDLVHKGVKDTTGLASLGGMCVPTMRCSVLEDNGLDIGITLAHETGHSLDMHHDGDGNFCYDKTNIMSTGGAGGSTALKWSSCSRDSLFDFIYHGKTKCLEDQPTANTFQLSKQLPGVIYSGDKQCELFLGQGSRICEDTSLVKPYGGDECGKLVCFDPNLPGQCTGSQAPRMDGTECGQRKWCISGVCTDIGTDGPAPQDGQWSPWGDYQAQCSRTCGGGVRVRTRKCDNPRALFGGRKCVGSDAMAVICNLEPCSTTQFNYKEEQCAATDGFPLKGKLLHWLPGDTIGESVCMLFCQPEGGDTIHLRGVGTDTMYRDGTECDSNNGTYNRCIKGACRGFGCDGVSDSPARPDVCGVCKGNSDTCEKKKGSYFQGVPKQYETFLVLPRGSTGIKITNDNRFTWMSILVNGKRMFNTNGFHRDKKDIYKKDGITVLYAPYKVESIQIEGPIPLQIEAQVYRRYGDDYNDVRPEIFYEYYQPLARHSPQVAASVSHTEVRPVNPAPEVYGWKSEQGQCSVTCGTGTAEVEVVCVRERDDTRVEQGHCDPGQKPIPQSAICTLQNCPTRWSTGSFGQCSKTCGGGARTRDVVCVSEGGEEVSDDQCPESRPPSRQICGTDICPVEWRAGTWSDCSVSCDEGTRQRKVTCHEGSDAPTDPSKCDINQKPVERETCNVTPCDAHAQGEGECKDSGTVTCVDYIKEVCDHYKEWSKLHCPRYCGMCQETTTLPAAATTGTTQSALTTTQYGLLTTVSTTTVSPNTALKIEASQCVDKASTNCQLYKNTVCTEYKEWSTINCPKYCGLCSGNEVKDTPTQTGRQVTGQGQTNISQGQHQGRNDNVGTGTTTIATFTSNHDISDLATTTLIPLSDSTECVNVLHNCHLYTQADCINFAEWGRRNCAQYCGYCRNSQQAARREATSVRTISTTSRTHTSVESNTVSTTTAASTSTTSKTSTTTVNPTTTPMTTATPTTFTTSITTTTPTTTSTTTTTTTTTTTSSTSTSTTTATTSTTSTTVTTTTIINTTTTTTTIMTSSHSTSTIPASSSTITHTTATATRPISTVNPSTATHIAFMTSTTTTLVPVTNLATNFDATSTSITTTNSNSAFTENSANAASSNNGFDPENNNSGDEVNQNPGFEGDPNVVGDSDTANSNENQYGNTDPNADSSNTDGSNNENTLNNDVDPNSNSFDPNTNTNAFDPNDANPDSNVINPNNADINTNTASGPNNENVNANANDNVNANTNDNANANTNDNANANAHHNANANDNANANHNANANDNTNANAAGILNNNDIADGVDALFDPQATSQECKDENADCALYNEKVCTEFETWSRINCKRRCNFCTSRSTCSNKNTQCEEYDQSVCKAYPEWAEVNCRRYCNYCT